MKNIIVVDIDGTLAKVGDRLKYLKQSPKDWDSFYKASFEDEPIKEVVDLISALQATEWYRIVLLTGRRESIRHITERWIDLNCSLNSDEEPMPNRDFDALIMRPNRDYRHDTEVKLEMFKKTGYAVEDISFVIEDRNSMVEMWRKLGVKCFQVADGDF